VDLGLNGKRALVTGSSSGIGAGIAAMLAQEGCAVIVHGRDQAKAEGVATRIGAAGIAIGDLANDAGAAAVAGAAGEVDILVNNAGGAVGTSAMSWTEVPPASWVETFETNVVAAARMIDLILPGMKARGWGRIVNIASAAATQPIEFGPDYGAAKAAMINMSVSLAKSLGACGVTVNSVSPGMILTPAVERWLTALAPRMGWEGLDLEAIERKVAETLTPIPVGRIGRVEEIAQVVCMIAGMRGGYMTGANIRVDGGQVQSVN
jgi:NAD(P)-dependent dehydrogenase (short-subunit alcohol dehydrogenase family)